MEEKLAVDQTTILKAELAQHYCSHAYPPVQTLAFIWLHGDLNKAAKTAESSPERKSE